MSESLTGNVLVAQSGGPTSVINASLAGVITEALNHDCIEEIYGGLNGIQGILNEEFIDLAEESQQTIRGLRHTPAAALGTCRYKMKPSDLERILEVFHAHNIRFFFYIGGNDSQDTTDQICKYAEEQGYDLKAIGIPKTIDNDLPITDHCPGYGSVIKYVATTVQEMALDHAAIGNHDFVSIVEVMGRNAGWIAAGATLAKGRSQDANAAPHLIYLPEVPLSPEKFLEDVQNVLKTEKYCMVVVSEGVTDGNGNYLGQASSATDAFGHSQLGGVGEYLRALVEQSLEIKARSAKLGINQRAAAHCSSETDNNEAFMCGQAAVQAAMAGQTDKMVTLVRSEADRYACETSLTPLSDVANEVKTIPSNWINETQTGVAYPFYKYALPLVEGEVQVPYEQGMPNFVKLAKNPVEKRLETYAMA
tara:strand:- start:18652 stop:19914 length:1263 start_codon:yes stop_codon:yes gene_type:complete